MPDRCLNDCIHIARGLHIWLCYIPLHRPTTLLICVLIVCDAIMEIWMACMTPLDAARKTVQPLNQLLHNPSVRFEKRKLAVWGLDYLSKKHFGAPRSPARTYPSMLRCYDPPRPFLLYWQWSLSVETDCLYWLIWVRFNIKPPYICTLGYIHYQLQPCLRFTWLHTRTRTHTHMRARDLFVLQIFQ